jgi:hypothetical protein
MQMPNGNRNGKWKWKFKRGTTQMQMQTADLGGLWRIGKLRMTRMAILQYQYGNGNYNMIIEYGI